MAGKRGMKRAQIMGMPIQMIFTMLIAAVFIVVAVVAIKNFLDVQKCSQIGLFSRDLQSEIDRVWQSQQAGKSFESSLPSSLQYVCFADLNSDKNIADTAGESGEVLSKIFDEFSRRKFQYAKKNLFLYPSRQACEMPAFEIKHVNTSIMPNPYCFKNADGKIKMRLSKGFDEAIVKVNRP